LEFSEHALLRCSNWERAVILTYASRDGQARRIAERIGRVLGVAARDLKTDAPDAHELALAPLLVVIAAVRYGKHLPEADAFLGTYANLSTQPSLALASVNLTARKEGKRSAEGNAYLRKLIAQYRLKPVLAAAFAGRLDFSRYRWSDRQLIRFIMLLTGGPTDRSAKVEYTDWAAVDDFAQTALALVHKRGFVID
jgi:menaquinone-dependent protoporphyrinogen oxidase